MRIVITGATSGIGRELAVQYAAAGVVLGLTGRRQDRLDEAAAACRARGAVVHTYAVDVVDRPAMATMARDFLAAAGGVDLVIANAGVGGPDKRSLDPGDADPMARLFETNVVGVVNTLVPFVPAMKAQRAGHLVAVASIAGFRALPGHAAYCASKSAVRMLMDGLGMDLRRHGIVCTSVNPGFVESELTAKNDFSMPFFLTTEVACRKIRRALARKRRAYTFPWQMALLCRLLVFAPEFIVRRLR
ncbi:MAG: SDR family NAD(P)-dependent oxidoreductase [Planctomycetota bacterium]|nr:SDR family NAD(P)-dependent oxidoreductase [Planctomycetota bacterium]